MTCDSHGVANSGTGNSLPNLRVVRRPERRGGTKTCGQVQGSRSGVPSSIMRQEMRAWRII